MKKIWASFLILCHLMVTSTSAIASALDDVAFHSLSAIGYEAPHVHAADQLHSDHESEDEHAQHEHEHNEGCHVHLLFQPVASHVFLTLPTQSERYAQTRFDSDSLTYSPETPPPTQSFFFPA